MTKTFIIIIIILAVLAYILYTQSYSTPNELFASVDNSNDVNKNTYSSNISDNYITNDTNNCTQIIQNNTYEDTDDSENSNIVREDENGLEINDCVVSYDDNTQESDNQIRKKFITREHQRKPGYKRNNYSQGKRGCNYDQAMDYIDESNELMLPGYSVNDQFMGTDEIKGQYAPYKPEKNPTNKFKASEIFNSQNYLPNEKSVNPDWFDVVPDAINVKNRHLINVSKPIGINTIGTSLRNPSYDIRGAPPNPKNVVSPWLQSTIEPDNNFKSLCM